MARSLPSLPRGKQKAIRGILSPRGKEFPRSAVRILTLQGQKLQYSFLWESPKVECGIPVGPACRAGPWRFPDSFGSPKRDKTKSKEPNPLKSHLLGARKWPKNAKNLFDASPYASTTSDPKLRFLKNITGFEPRDLIALDSSWDRFSSCDVGQVFNLSRSRSRLPGGTSPD
jgi:hypothetical protein